MSIEKRTHGLQIRADEIVNGGSDLPQLTLSGYAAKYNSKSTDLGGFRETIMPGAFDRALKKNADVRALKNHDPNFVLGRTKSGTLRLTTDFVGLRFTVDLPPTQYALDLHTAVKRGDMDQCSFAFKALDDSWDDDDEDRSLRLRTLRAVDLFDISAVTYPAYEDTVVSARALQMVAARRTAAPSNRPMNDYEQLLFKAVLQLDAINFDEERARRESEARVAGFNEEKFHQLQRMLTALEQPAKYFRTIEEVCAAQQHLREFLAVQ